MTCFIIHIHVHLSGLKSQNSWKEIHSISTIYAIYSLPYPTCPSSISNWQNLLFWICFIYSAEQALIQSSSSPSRCMVYSAHFVRFSKHQKNIIYTIKTVLYEHVQCRLSPCTICCCCCFSQSDALNLMVISLIFVAYSYLFWDI